MDDSITRAAAAKPSKKLARTIARVAKARPQPTGFRIPTLAAGAQPDDDTNIWLAPSGALLWYREDGVLMKAALASGFVADGVAAADEPDQTTYTCRAFVGGNATTEGQVVDIYSVCPTHGLELGGFYGYAPGHGNRILTFFVYFGTAVNAGGGGPVNGAGLLRTATIKFRNVATFSGGPVQIHVGLTQPTSISGGVLTTPLVPTYRDVLVDTWPAVGYGGDLDGDHDLPIGVLSDQVPDFGWPYGSQSFMIAQPDADLASAGQLDPDSIEVSITWTDQVYP